jgi:proline iminopeptidase
MTDAKLAPGLPDWMVDHANRYLESGGTDGHVYTIKRAGQPDRTVPCLLLVTTGRKSGAQYIFPLIYGQAGSSYFVIASKGGAPEHPSWYRNLVENPSVEIQVGTLKTKATARTATGEERAKLWAEGVAIFPPFADYQVKAPHREIPVVVLDPVG